MRINCRHCLKKATITSSNVLSPAVTDLYCQCTNIPDCGASFVATLSHKHDLNPPIKSTQELAASLLRNLSLKERQELIQNDLFGLSTG